jgi:hypothetical protein
MSVADPTAEVALMPAERQASFDVRLSSANPGTGIRYVEGSDVQLHMEAVRFRNTCRQDPGPGI